VVTCGASWSLDEAEKENEAAAGVCKSVMDADDDVDVDAAAAAAAAA
jgi:hypothetical protein